VPTGDGCGPETRLRRSQRNEFRSCLRNELFDSVEVMMEEGIPLVVVECELRRNSQGCS
jgi:hypothetical protein